VVAAVGSNFRADDGTTGGRYLRHGDLWSHVTSDVEVNLDLVDIVPVLPDGVLVAQVDGGVTPDSLTPESGSRAVSLDELVDQDGVSNVSNGSERGEYLDDGYTDQESVFGDGEADFVYKGLFDKFVTSHSDRWAEPEQGRRLSQALDLEVPVLPPCMVEVEKFIDFPSLASFPVEDVAVPGYNYHLVRRRTMSLSSPEICDDRQSRSAWQEWYERVWKWGRVFRRGQL
jgi:hypothetical protein